MERYRNIVDTEENRCSNMVDQMRLVLESEQKDRFSINREISDLKQQKLNTSDWKEKEEIEDLINIVRGRMVARNYQDNKIVRKPYFGVFELEDDDLGNLLYCIGAHSFFGQNGKVLVIDWRDAPISRLYYEYQVGEEYDEDIRGRERSGVIRTKRQIEIVDGQVQTITQKDLLLVKDEDGSWQSVDKDKSAAERKEAKKDHRLPEITALISREQFQAITEDHSRTFLLQGGAGSGKTTVGLHRIAYLMFQDRQRFAPNQILVVMFNRSLQTYISGVLPELKVESGIRINTFHTWAGQILKNVGIRISYSKQKPAEQILKLKKSTLPLLLIDAYVDRLLEKSRTWLIDKLTEKKDPSIEKVSKKVFSAESIQRFCQILEEHALFTSPNIPEPRKELAEKLVNRLSDHGADLYIALTDPELTDDLKATSNIDIPKEDIDRLQAWQTDLKERGEFDFADIGIMLYLLQKKGVEEALPDFAHIMVDEAQDFSAVELATIILAADKEQSLTICGDMAQKIKGDVVFDSPEGFVGFVKKLQAQKGRVNISAETLTVGYRATAQIMELAWHVLGSRPGMTSARQGDPVTFEYTQNEKETQHALETLLKKYFKERPKALVGVICKFKSHADQIYERLKGAGIENLRRHERDNFTFQPGVIVTNAHQVKGLEFSAVVVVNPASNQYKDNLPDRMLLHVVITRASDQLWIVGHDPLAYDLDHYQSGEQTNASDS